MIIIWYRFTDSQWSTNGTYGVVHEVLFLKSWKWKNQKLCYWQYFSKGIVGAFLLSVFHALKPFLDESHLNKSHIYALLMKPCINKKVLPYAKQTGRAAKRREAKHGSDETRQQNARNPREKHEFNTPSCFRVHRTHSYFWRPP